MSKRKHEAREELRGSAEQLAKEAFSGRWDEAADLANQPLIQNRALLKELESRCPGHHTEEYEDAFSRAVRENR